MQYKEFYEVDLYKPGIISLTGPAITNKKVFAQKLIKSIHDRSEKDRFKDKFNITIFSHGNIQNYGKDMGRINVYMDWNKLKDYYLIKKHYLKKTGSLETEILLLDENITKFTLKNKYLKKLFEKCKKFNLTIIYYSYWLTFDIKNDYNLFIKESFSSNLKKIYDHFYKKFMTFDEFKIRFDDITKDEGVLVVNDSLTKSFHKLARLYDSNATRRNYKYQDPNYNAISDESDILFF